MIGYRCSTEKLLFWRCCKCLSICIDHQLLKTTTTDDHPKWQEQYQGYCKLLNMEQIAICKLNNCHASFCFNFVSKPVDVWVWTWKVMCESGSSSNSSFISWICNLDKKIFVQLSLDSLKMSYCYYLISSNMEIFYFSKQLQKAWIG